MMEFQPNGDFHSLLTDKKPLLDEKLTRTYFRQLLDALDYIHAQDIAHMDIKLENVMLGKNFSLKLVDFDLSYHPKVGRIRGRGTNNYRSPELREKHKADVDPKKCDIFSLGVFMFILHSRGTIPFKETNNGNPLLEDLTSSPKLFWQTHKRLKNRPEGFWSDDFKSLFEALCAKDPKKRPTVSEIKRHPWVLGDTYTASELKSVMSKYYMPK
mmetsp:Transcript_5056/g.4250  ORF Transcript_5056/g.4250 Transcript_5056/m.4250 type:complete len:213 (+) Transcript_5056:366-1004(+)